VHVTSQSGPKGCFGNLAIDLLLEAAGHLGEGVAAALELRRADRAGACAAGALLAPRLRAAAGDHPAALRLRRAGAAGVRLGAHGLVDEMRLHLGGEDRLVEGVLLLGALHAEHRCLRSCHQPRTSTSPSFGPGTEPLTSRRLFSGSTSCTCRPVCVIRLPPIRPGSFMPLKTRDGVADAPTEPGLRMLCEPWPRGPLEKLWRLIVPWKPLPIAVAETLIASPGWKTST